MSKHKVFNYNNNCIRILFYTGAVFIFCGVPFFLSGCNENLTYVHRSRSMTPTILPNTTINVDPLAYKHKDPNRWDLIVFRYPCETNSLFAMRVVGLPNESVLLAGNKLLVNGEICDLPHNLNIVLATHPDQKYAYEHPFEIPAGHVFVLGDNAKGANDSRFWGALSEDLIIGKIKDKGKSRSKGAGVSPKAPIKAGRK